MEEQTMSGQCTDLT